MVNTGKPSGGCKLCKLRRIKCDEVKPFCMKCKKAKRECPGYSDPFEAKIRDQTQATIRRFRKMRGDTTGAENRTSPPQASFIECLQTPFTSYKQATTTSAMTVLHRRNGSNSSNSSNSSLDSLVSTSSTSSASSDGDNGRHDQYIPFSIINHLEDRATSYFLSEFVLIPMREGNLPVRGYFPWVPKFMSKTQPAKVFLSAFRATSLASIATQHGKAVIGSALSAAQRHYLDAVRAMNQAIQDPTLAKSDETLAAVLLLGLYEGPTDTGHVLTRLHQGVHQPHERRGHDGRRFRKMRGDTTGAENRTSPPQAPFTECLQTPFTSHKQTTTTSAMAVLHRRNGSSNSNSSSSSSNSSLDSLMSTSSASSTSSDGDNGRADQYIPPSIISHLEDRATSYFLSEFVLIPMREGNLPVRGCFPWVPKFMSKTQPAKVFLSAFRATSLASIATQHGKTVIGSALSAAQRHYLVAVRAMNQAIQDPTLAKSDETLAAVLLLALYETLVTSSRGSIKEYINHMKGAAMMVKLRGEQGLATQEGEAMFTTTRNHVLGFSCLPCAPEISEFTWLLRHTCAREKDIAALNIANSAIRQDIDRVFRMARDAGHDNRHPRTVQRVLTILQSARALEARYRRLNDTHVTRNHVLGFS
ncbi:hypothetical protein BN1723_003943 [Verticillium longisporum]|uniref:Zn(2)-C6 fungal-type domain-containing protein n=1 Tax=Verticillium longisporum TaxID=100787 RepID=A0A0G4MGI0_VERLO|nr:hypothetical protein BN1723_003943 [Verticillium longisporum]